MPRVFCMSSALFSENLRFGNINFRILHCPATSTKLIKNKLTIVNYMVNLDTPQEVEVWYVLPALRKELSIALKETMQQKDVAKLLGITESAISQYSKQKRAAKLKFNQEIKKEIKKSAKRIEKNKTTVAEELQRLCKIIKKRHILCQLHKKYCKTPLNKCEVCFK